MWRNNLMRRENSFICYVYLNNFLVFSTLWKNKINITLLFSPALLMKSLMFNDLLFSSNKFYHICHFLFLALTIIYVYVGFSYLTIRHSIIPFKLRSFIIHKLANSQPLANFQPQFLKYVYSPFVIIVNLKKII